MEKTNKKQHQIKKGLYFFWCAIFYFLCCFSVNAPASTVGGHVRQGNRLYEDKKFEEAIQKYQHALKKQSESGIINFNAGTASYQSGDFQKAQGYFQKALLSSDDHLRQQAHYNLGNTLYRQAEALGPQDLQSAVPLLEGSLGQYEQAIALWPEDEDAQYNYDFVKNVLEKVKEQIEKQQQQCENSGDGEQGDQNGKDKNGQNNQEKTEAGAQQGDDGQGGQQDQKEQELRESSNQDMSAGSPENKDEGQSSQQSQSDQSEKDQQDLSRREAERRLLEYQRNEEPKGILNLRGKFDARPVEKDW